MSNERGQYGFRLRVNVGAEAPKPSGRTIGSIAPWIIGGVGVTVVTLLGAHAAAARPRLTAHEREVRAWEAEFPGLPWRMDEVKDSRQLDLWERARDYWESRKRKF